jgi:hypothetical protein
MAQRSPEAARRLFRRLRAKFKKDLGGPETLTGSDRVLIDQAALLALRARQARDDLLSGDKVVSDEDLIRLQNSLVRVLEVLNLQRKKDERENRERLAAFQAARRSRT